MDSSGPNVIGNLDDLEDSDDSEGFFFTKEDYMKALKSMRYEKTMTLKPKMKHRIILWFRNDLRTHDSGILNWAISQKSEVEHKECLPVYCFDPRLYNDPVPKFSANRKAGIHKTRF